MRKIILTAILCLICLIFFQCKQTTEPVQQNDSVTGITETGSESPADFIGTLDLHDWDPSSYQHLTITKNYWIDKATTDTISISGDNVTPLKIHNLSQTTLEVAITVSLPFHCSIDSISIAGGQTGILNLTIDTNSVGTDTIIIQSIHLAFSNNDQLQYVVGWAKPRYTGGGVVVIGIPLKNRLYPAYPNPASGPIAFSYSLSSDQTVFLYVLNDKLEPVDTLDHSFKKAGLYLYNWRTTIEGQSKFQAGYYRVVLKTDAYSRSGDILINN